MIVKASRHPFAETVARLSKSITDHGNTIFATLDQSKAATDAGLTLRPTTLLLFGNPQAGTPLMDAYPAVALELPLKVVVWEEAGKVSVAYEPATEFAARHEVLGMDLQLARMDGAVDVMTDAIL